MNRLSGWLCPALYLLFLSLLLSCASNQHTLPEMTPTHTTTLKCPALFPPGGCQAVHDIEFTMPGSRQGRAIGVTVVSEDGTIESTLMTVEGFVLFAASLNDTLTIHRAVPPFDKPGFAAGMMEDIRSIFLHPQGRIETGTLADTSSICRITTDSGRVIDSLSLANQSRQINIYSPDGTLERSISGRDYTAHTPNISIPKILELTAPGMNGYTLNLTLIRFEDSSTLKQ